MRTVVTLSFNLKSSITNTNLQIQDDLKLLETTSMIPLSKVDFKTNIDGKHNVCFPKGISNVFFFLQDKTSLFLRWRKLIYLKKDRNDLLHPFLYVLAFSTAPIIPLKLFKITRSMQCFKVIVCFFDLGIETVSAKQF